ncbi:hypothetical protein phytr_8580 [Candidatus Phycorickettsia trachydisci]|uniref:WH2 domain-containing protein n=1 Tax=Candidatus Phycorickettsia trachydisci TaxID=2115978 RepID=A0A2P1P945_9RICK|nr:type IV secretion system protein [Candidatus Phycorickettsia trachydisci]AVP87790.1 hypothetical protein phytr_8580 [Candidatus Phycorickettsia trachydisci]
MFRYIVFIVLISFCTNARAAPSWFGGNPFSYVGSNAPSGSSSTGDLDFSGLKTSFIAPGINDTTNGGWKNTGIQAVSGQAMSFQKDLSKGVIINPVVYLIEYRADYRFNYPVVFIYTCNSSGTSCTPDYSNYSGLSSTNASSNTVSVLNNYFAMQNRGIPVYTGDLVNITYPNLTSSMIDIGSASVSTTGTYINLLELNSKAGYSSDNTMFNMSADDFCRNNTSLITSGFSTYCILGSNNLYQYKIQTSTTSALYNIVGGISPLANYSIPSCNSSASYYRTNFLNSIISAMSSSSSSLYLGAVDNWIRNYLLLGGTFNDIRSTYTSLSSKPSSIGQTSYPYLYQLANGDTSTDSDLQAIALSTTLNYCLQDKGLGLEVDVGTTVVKTEQTPFIPIVTSSVTNYVYSFTSPVDGLLSFRNTAKINSGATYPFDNFDARISATSASSSPYSSFISSSNKMNGLNFGRYLLEVRVGRGSAYVANVLSNLQYNYYIQSSGGSSPTSSTSGTTIPGFGQFVAPSSGTIWVKVTSSDPNVSGSAYTKVQANNGSQALSDGLNKYVVQPIISQFAIMMRLIYDGPTGLINNSVLIKIVKTAAVLYVIIFAIYFLFGQVKITVEELVSRIVKITLTVNILFSSQSWTFFNTYLFDSVLRGTNYFILVFTGQDAASMTPFTFLDPIFNTYTSPAFWGAIFVQFVQIWNGLSFMAIITVMGIGVFLTAVFEVVMTYVLAFITMYILIGIAPIFIPLMLFGATSEFFYRWIQTLVKSMLVPVVFIVLILTFDIFIHQVLRSTVVSNHWGCLKFFSIHVNLGGKDLTLLDNNSNFCLPFFVPNVTNSYSTSSQSILNNLQNISTTDLQATAMAGAQSSTSAGTGNDSLAILDNTSQQSTVGVSSLAQSVLLGYMNVIRAAFLYFTYAIVAKRLLGITEEIVGKITGITASTFDKAVGQMKAAPQDIHSTLSRNVEIYKKSADAVSKLPGQAMRAISAIDAGIGQGISALKQSNSWKGRLLGQALGGIRGATKMVTGAVKGIYKFEKGMLNLMKPSYDDDILQRPGRFVKHVTDTVKTAAWATKTALKVATFLPMKAAEVVARQLFKDLYFKKHKDKALKGILDGMSSEDKAKFSKMSYKEKNKMLDDMMNKEASAYANERWQKLNPSRLLNPLKLADEARFRRKHKGEFADLYSVAGRAKYREAMNDYTAYKGQQRFDRVFSPVKRYVDEARFREKYKDKFTDLNTAAGKAKYREEMAAYSAEKGKERLGMVLNPLRAWNERSFKNVNKSIYQGQYKYIKGLEEALKDKSLDPNKAKEFQAFIDKNKATYQGLHTTAGRAALRDAAKFYADDKARSRSLLQFLPKSKRRDEEQFMRENRGKFTELHTIEGMQKLRAAAKGFAAERAEYRALDRYGKGFFQQNKGNFADTVEGRGNLRQAAREYSAQVKQDRMAEFEKNPRGVIGALITDKVFGQSFRKSRELLSKKYDEDKLSKMSPAEIIREAAGDNRATFRTRASTNISNTASLTRKSVLEAPSRFVSGVNSVKGYALQSGAVVAQMPSKARDALGAKIDATSRVIDTKVRNVNTLMDNLVKAGASDLKDISSRVKETRNDAVQGVRSAATSFVSGVGAVRNLASQGAQLFRTGVNAARTTMDNLAKAGASDLRDIRSRVKETRNEAVQGARSAVKDVVSGVSAVRNFASQGARMVTTGFNAVRTTMDNLVKAGASDLRRFRSDVKDTRDYIVSGVASGANAMASTRIGKNIVTGAKFVGALPPVRGLASGLAAAGGGIVSGARTVGRGIATGTGIIGGAVAGGARYVGGGVAAGAGIIGGGIATGAGIIRGAVAGGARYVGDGVGYVGGKIATGAKTVGGGIATGARTVGGGIAAGAGIIGGGVATGAGIIGGGIATGAKTVGGGIATGARTVGGGIAAGAGIIGGGIATGAKTVGGGIATGARTVGGGIAAGAGIIGGGIATGAGIIGGGIATGAKTVGGGIATGARTVGGGIATGAKTVGGGIATGARTVGGGIATGAGIIGGGIATGAGIIGGGIATGAKTVGGGIATGARTVGGGIASGVGAAGGFVASGVGAVALLGGLAAKGVSNVALGGVSMTGKVISRVGTAALGLPSLAKRVGRGVVDVVSDNASRATKSVTKGVDGFREVVSTKIDAVGRDIDKGIRGVGTTVINSRAVTAVTKFGSATLDKVSALSSAAYSGAGKGVREFRDSADRSPVVQVPSMFVSKVANSIVGKGVSWGVGRIAVGAGAVGGALSWAAGSALRGAAAGARDILDRAQAPMLQYARDSLTDRYAKKITDDYIKQVGKDQAKKDILSGNFKVYDQADQAYRQLASRLGSNRSIIKEALKQDGSEMRSSIMKNMDGVAIRSATSKYAGEAGRDLYNHLAEGGKLGAEAISKGWRYSKAAAIQGLDNAIVGSVKGLSQIMTGSVKGVVFADKLMDKVLEAQIMGGLKLIGALAGFALDSVAGPPPGLSADQLKNWEKQRREALGGDLYDIFLNSSKSQLGAIPGLDAKTAAVSLVNPMAGAYMMYRNNSGLPDTPGSKMMTLGLINPVLGAGYAAGYAGQRGLEGARQALSEIRQPPSSDKSVTFNLGNETYVLQHSKKSEPVLVRMTPNGPAGPGIMLKEGKNTLSLGDQSATISVLSKKDAFGRVSYSAGLVIDPAYAKITESRALSYGPKIGDMQKPNTINIAGQERSVLSAYGKPLESGLMGKATLLNTNKAGRTTVITVGSREFLPDIKQGVQLKKVSEEGRDESRKRALTPRDNLLGDIRKGVVLKQAGVDGRQAAIDRSNERSRAQRNIIANAVKAREDRLDAGVLAARDQKREADSLRRSIEAKKEALALFKEGSGTIELSKKTEKFLNRLKASDETLQEFNNLKSKGSLSDSESVRLAELRIQINKDKTYENSLGRLGKEVEGLREGVRDARKDFEKRTMGDIAGSKDKMERSSEMSKAIGREEALLKAIGSSVERRQDTLDAVRALGGKSKDLEQAEKTVAQSMAAIKSGRDLSKTEVENLSNATKIIKEAKELSVNAFDLARGELGNIRRDRKEALKKYESATRGVLSKIDSRSQQINDSKKERDEELKVLRSMRGVGGVASPARATTDALRESISAQAALGSARDNFERVIKATQTRDVSTEELKLLAKATEQIKRSDGASKNALDKLEKERESIVDAKRKIFSGIAADAAARGKQLQERRAEEREAITKLSPIAAAAAAKARKYSAFDAALKSKQADDRLDPKRTAESAKVDLAKRIAQLEGSDRFAPTNVESGLKLGKASYDGVGDKLVVRSGVAGESDRMLKMTGAQDAQLSRKTFEAAKEIAKSSDSFKEITGVPAGSRKEALEKAFGLTQSADLRAKNLINDVARGQKEAGDLKQSLERDTERLSKFLSNDKDRNQLVEKNKGILDNINVLNVQFSKDKSRFEELSKKQDDRTLTGLERIELSKLRETISKTEDSYKSALQGLKDRNEEINKQVRQQDALQAVTRGYVVRRAADKEATASIERTAERKGQAAELMSQLAKDTKILSKNLSDEGRAQLAERNEKILGRIKELDTQFKDDSVRFRELSQKQKEGALLSQEKAELGKLRERIIQSSEAYKSALDGLKDQSADISKQRENTVLRLRNERAALRDQRASSGEARFGAAAGIFRDAEKRADIAEQRSKDAVARQSSIAAVEGARENAAKLWSDGSGRIRSAPSSEQLKTPSQVEKLITGSAVIASPLVARTVTQARGAPSDLDRKKESSKSVQGDEWKTVTKGKAVDAPTIASSLREYKQQETAATKIQGAFRTRAAINDAKDQLSALRVEKNKREAALDKAALDTYKGKMTDVLGEMKTKQESSVQRAQADLKSHKEKFTDISKQAAKGAAFAEGARAIRAASRDEASNVGKIDIADRALVLEAARARDERRKDARDASTKGDVTVIVRASALQAAKDRDQDRQADRQRAAAIIPELQQKYAAAMKDLEDANRRYNNAEKFVKDRGMSPTALLREREDSEGSSGLGSWLRGLRGDIVKEQAKEILWGAAKVKESVEAEYKQIEAELKKAQQAARQIGKEAPTQVSEADLKSHKEKFTGIAVSAASAATEGAFAKGERAIRAADRGEASNIGQKFDIAERTSALQASRADDERKQNIRASEERKRDVRDAASSGGVSIAERIDALQRSMTSDKLQKVTREGVKKQEVAKEASVQRAQADLKDHKEKFTGIAASASTEGAFAKGERAIRAADRDEASNIGKVAGVDMKQRASALQASRADDERKQNIRAADERKRDARDAASSGGVNIAERTSALQRSMTSDKLQKVTREGVQKQEVAKEASVQRAQADLRDHKEKFTDIAASAATEGAFAKGERAIRAADRGEASNIGQKFDIAERTSALQASRAADERRQNIRAADERKRDARDAASSGGINIAERASALQASMAGDLGRQGERFDIIKKMNVKISGFNEEKFSKDINSEIKKLEKNNVDTSSLRGEVNESLKQLTESRDKFLDTFKVYQDLVSKKEAGTLSSDERDKFIDLNKQIQDSSKEFRETQERIVTKVQQGAISDNRGDQERVSIRPATPSLNYKADANTNNFLGAVATGNFADLKRVKDNTNIFAKDERGNTALHIAARNGREDVIEYLLSINPDISKLVTEKNQAGYTAMDMAMAAARSSDPLKRVNTKGVQRVLANQEIEKSLLETNENIEKFNKYIEKAQEQGISINRDELTKVQELIERAENRISSVRKDLDTKASNNDSRSKLTDSTFNVNFQRAQKALTQSQEALENLQKIAPLRQEKASGKQQLKRQSTDEDRGGAALARSKSEIITQDIELGVQRKVTVTPPQVTRQEQASSKSAISGSAEGAKAAPTLTTLEGRKVSSKPSDEGSPKNSSTSSGGGSAAPRGSTNKPKDSKG